MCQRNTVWMFPTSSVQQFHDKLANLFHRRNVTMFQWNTAQMCQGRPVDPTPGRSVNPSPSNIVNLFQTRDVKLFPKKNVTKSATMFIGASFVFDSSPTINCNSLRNIESITLTSLPFFCTLITKNIKLKNMFLLILCLITDNIWQ